MIANDEDNTLQSYITSRPEITFLKNIYRRHTSIVSEKKIYVSINNRIKIDDANNDIKCINKMWIKNNNIKNISIFLVHNNVDINSVNIDTNDSEDHNIQVIHKIDIMALMSLNKLIKNDDLVNLEIPFNENQLVPKLVNMDNRNMNILIVFEPQQLINGQNFELLIKYCITIDPDEIHKFNSFHHEYLFKRILSYKYELNEGENTINMITNLPVALIILNNTKKLICPVIKVDSHIVQHENVVDQNILSSDIDPEYNIKSDIIDTYIIDAYQNTNINRVQPAGIINIGNDSYFKINALEKTSITITYIIYDVLSIQNNVYFRFKHNPIPEPIPEPILEPIQLQRPMIDLHETPINQHEPPVVIFDLPEPPVDRHDYKGI